jgi:hypothetical protein
MWWPWSKKKEKKSNDTYDAWELGQTAGKQNIKNYSIDEWDKFRYWHPTRSLADQAYSEMLARDVDVSDVEATRPMYDQIASKYENLQSQFLAGHKSGHNLFVKMEHGPNNPQLFNWSPLFEFGYMSELTENPFV